MRRYNDAKTGAALSQKKTHWEVWPYLVLLLVSLVLAFWFRWQFLQNINLYPDEFVTLLAMDMITQKGAPILPSGLFYEHGLLYSYLAGAASLLGDAVFWGRFTSLVLGLITILLTYIVGHRWFSPMVGALAAIGLALAPAAIHWSGRVRMYALLQVLVLLTIWLMMEGLFHNRKRLAWASVLAYVGALLTQFVSLALLPPLTVAETIGFMTQPNRRGWYRDPQLWLRGLAVGAAVLAVILVKRAGQPKGLEPLEAGNAVGGVWQILTTYSSFSFNVGQSWQAISPFFLDTPNLIFTAFIPIAVIAALWPKPRYGATLFLLIILVLTTLEVVLFAPSDRRDDKYLFMLMPIVCLLGGQGICVIINLVASRLSQTRKYWIRAICAVTVSLSLVIASRSHINGLLSDVGEDYETTFVYVAENIGPDNAILTGTPTAAYHFLGWNDLYAVQAGGLYDYRILNQPDQGLVERWLGSPWIKTVEELNAALKKQTVWLVLERWGLLIQYYDPLFMQNILAQTEFVREDNGIIALKSRPQPNDITARTYRLC